ncbi:MAG TPA: hypothetical protein VK952_05270, partial [Methylotenera sp.]|nr:hypothetical protein [Methylotenera sp.]
MRKKFDINRRFFLALSAGAGLTFCYLGAKNVLAKKPDSNHFAKKAPSANARLGINLAGLADWNTELPFVDLFRMSREWVSQPKDGAWGSG